MNLIGKKVKHVFSGEGEITNQTEAKVYVSIGNDTQSYPFPNAFLNGSLTLLPIEQNLVLLNEIKANGYDDNIQKVKVSNSSGFSPSILKLAEPRKIKARTNVDFLKELNIKAKNPMASGHPISSNILIWMVYIDGKEREFWMNVWENENTIKEYYIGPPAKQHHVKEKYRIVVEKIGYGENRIYNVRGLFKLYKELDGSTVHIWKREI